METIRVINHFVHASKQDVFIKVVCKPDDWGYYGGDKPLIDNESDYEICALESKIYTKKY